jgi:ribose 5-phosphate isomerase B
MKIVIGSDHAGFECKEFVKEFLIKNGYSVEDKGTFSNSSVDYPDFAHLVAQSVSENSTYYGLLFCGSGNGVCISANKHRNIRAALAWNEEISRLARQHNNANILCLPARYIDNTSAINIVKTFLITPFEGGRHQIRVSKIELNG